MNNRQMMLTAVLSSLFTLTIIAGLMWLMGQASAAPPPKTGQTPAGQTITPTLQYISISGVAFSPIQQNMAYTKDVRQQLLGLAGQSRNFGAGSNLFIAPLTLPDRSELFGITVFGADFDNQGEVRVRLKRCNHGQAFCVILAETTSTAAYALGPFETSRISVFNEIVDNQFYASFLELDLTALGNSGLRSVRLEVLSQAEAPFTAKKEPWLMQGPDRTFGLPNNTTRTRDVEICIDDLTRSNTDPIHYLSSTAESVEVARLSSSNPCTKVAGEKIEIKRTLNTSRWSGTYQFLR